MAFWKSVAVLAPAVLLAAVSANAAEYIVSTSGNDANPGTLSSPLKSITTAASKAAPGDVVSVRGGVYPEIVKIASKGTSSARIVFRSYPGETAVIDGAGLAADTNLVQITNAQYIDFSGFEVRNATRIGICGYPGTNVRILGNNIHDAWKNAIYFGASSADVTIDGNDVHDNCLVNQYHTMTGGWPQAVSTNNTTRATVTNNRVYHNDGEGIDFIVTDYGVARSNVVYDNFSVGIYLDNAQYTTVDRNLVYSTGNSRYYRSGAPAMGISAANETYATMNPLTDVQITNNIVLNSKAGFYYGAYGSGGGLKNTTIANNTFYNATYYLIYIASDAHSGSVVENNVFYQTGGQGIASVAGSGISYHNNEWYGGTPGTAGGAGDVIADPRFANPGGLTAADYKLTSLSPALVAGSAVASVTVDYFGTPRLTTLDLGAHQYSLSGTSGGSPAPSPDTTAPTAPSALQASSISASSVGLVWQASTDNVGVASYRVYRNGALVATVSTTSWSNSGLAASTTYSYSVTAVDAAGNASPSSNVLSVTTSSSTKHKGRASAR